MKGLKEGKKSTKMLLREQDIKNMLMGRSVSVWQVTKTKRIQSKLYRIGTYDIRKIS